MKHFALFVTLLACLSTGCNRQTELVSAQETTRNQSGSDNADNSDNKTKPTGLIKRHPQLDQLLDPRPHAAPLFPVARSNATANPFVQTLQLFLSQTKALRFHRTLLVHFQMQQPLADVIFAQFIGGQSAKFRQLLYHADVSIDCTIGWRNVELSLRVLCGLLSAGSSCR